MPVTLTFLDGVGCIGGTKVLLEADSGSLLLDFGVNFAAERAFFDEFLRPRGSVGIGDLLELGLLPPLRGIYRRDLDQPARQWWSRVEGRRGCRRVEVAGVLLSHAHLDHSGYISFLEGSIPVFTGLASAVIAKAVQDTVPGTMEREVAYLTPREEKDGLLRAVDYRKAPARLRPFVVFSPGFTPARGQAAAEFWLRPPASRDLEGDPLRVVEGREAHVAGMRVRWWPVDHSVPGAGAFGVETPAGWVVYTGDLRMHGSRGHLTRAFAEEAARLEPVLLLCEGTHPRSGPPVGEEEVRQRACEAVRRAEGLVIADFGPRHVERLLSFLEAARAAGRRLAVTARDAYLLEALHAAGEGDAPDPFGEPCLAVYFEAKVQRPVWERVLMERYLASCPDRVVSAREVAARPGEYVCAFSYWDLSELVDIAPRGGTYIYSSTEAFNEEMHMDLDRLRNWIAHFGLRMLGDPGDRSGQGRDPGWHASGHIHGAGLVELVETIRPRCLVPVHTEDPAFFLENLGRLTRVFIPEPGSTLVL